MYEKFLKEFDKQLEKLFLKQKKYIKCSKNCCQCCEKGEYPLSQTEVFYITEGYINLPPELKKTVQQNIKKLLEEKKNYKGERFEHTCPFLINKECCVYPYRGIICRTFGLAYYDKKNKYVRLPDCVNNGLNYAEYYDPNTRILNISDVVRENLRTDKILTGRLAQKFGINCGEIRPMLDWLEG